MDESPGSQDPNGTESKKSAWWKRRFIRIPVWGWILISLAIFGYFGDDESTTTEGQGSAASPSITTTATSTTLARLSTTTTLRPTTTVRPVVTTTTTTTPDGEKWSAKGDMRFRFLKNGEYRCPSGTVRCVGLLVYSVTGCQRTGYIELNVLNSNDFVVGRANDLIPSLRVNEIYRTVISTYEDGASKVRLNEIRC